MTNFAVEHRPWPPPTRRFLMHMTWYDLAFLHWPVDADLLRPLIPPRLKLGTWDGRAWLGVVPFGMCDVRPRGCPRLPCVSRFLELNLRTYVVADGKHGVWFFSLDAANRLAVRAARRAFHLPYFDARMSLDRDNAGWHNFASRRTHRRASQAEFCAHYRPCGEVYQATPGTLEYWLTERYCLYAADRRGRVFRGEVHHRPWPLQRGEVVIERNSIAAPIGIDMPDPPTWVHFAARIETVAWALQRLD